MIKNLAGRLKELRIQNKLTQKQVSELLGISPSIISGYETGERTPSAEMALIWLGVSPLVSSKIAGISLLFPSK